MNRSCFRPLRLCVYPRLSFGGRARRKTQGRSDGGGSEDSAHAKPSAIPAIAFPRDQLRVLLFCFFFCFGASGYLVDAGDKSSPPQWKWIAAMRILEFFSGGITRGAKRSALSPLLSGGGPARFFAGPWGPPSPGASPSPEGRGGGEGWRANRVEQIIREYSE